MSSSSPSSSGSDQQQNNGAGIITNLKPSGVAHLAYSMMAISGIGGLAGYLKGKSTRSLAAGIVFGGGFGYSGYLIQNHEEVRGFRLAAFNSVLLTIVMGQRYFKTRNPMPAVPLIIAGFGSTIYHGQKYLEWTEE